MARPHIEFMHSRWLPRLTAWPGADSRPGVGCQVLSRDPDDGACSLLLHSSALYFSFLFFILPSPVIITLAVYRCIMLVSIG